MGLIDLIITSPRISIVVISFLVTFFITLVRYFMTDRIRMGEIRDRQKTLRQEMKKHKDNPEKMMELNKKMMEDLPEQLKHSFKPMIITLIPILILITWLKEIYATSAIATTWLWWYLGASIILSIILNKLFGLQ